MFHEKAINEAIEILATQFSPDKIILFGSHARGTATEQSDVDFLVLCDCKGRKGRLTDDMHEALKDMPFPKDIVVMSPKEFELDRQIPGTLARPVGREGIVLYERGN